MQIIAICEDENIWTEQLVEILNSIKTEGELQIHTFHSGEEFLTNYTCGLFDLVFMDIYLEEDSSSEIKRLNGVETIKKLREIDKDVPVAFTTTSLDHALDAYRLNVVKYLEKPVKREEVLNCLQIAQLAKENIKKITLMIAGKERSFSEGAITYMEQRNHTVYLHLSDQTVLSCTGKLDDFSGSLPSPPFYRCHKSYVANLAHVVKIDQSLKSFVMKDGSNVYIKREKLKEAGLQLDHYLFEQLRKD